MSSLRAVYKYQMEGFDQTLELPAASKFLYAQVQNGKHTLWFEVLIPVELQKPVNRFFFVVGTGFNFDRHIPDLGVAVHCQTYTEGPFVWHLYERRHVAL